MGRKIKYSAIASINPGDITSSHILDAELVNADIAATAAIAGSKLQALSVGVNAGVIPSTGVADAHVAATAAVAGSKLQALSVGANAGVIPSTGVADAHVAATAAVAGSKLQALVVGTNAGVIPSTGVAAAHVSATAAIEDTKLATIATAGKVSGAALTLLANIPSGAGVIPAANLPSGVAYAFGIATRTNADGTGDQVITHSLGVTPKMIKITYMAADGVQSSVNGIGIATGAAADQTIIHYDDNVTANTDNVAIEDTATMIGIRTGNGGATNSGRADLSAVSTTTFTLNWTTAVAAGYSPVRMLWEVMG